MLSWAEHDLISSLGRRNILSWGGKLSDVRSTGTNNSPWEVVAESFKTIEPYTIYIDDMTDNDIIMYLPKINPDDKYRIPTLALVDDEYIPKHVSHQERRKYKGYNTEEEARADEANGWTYEGIFYGKQLIGKSGLTRVSSLLAPIFEKLQAGNAPVTPREAASNFKALPPMSGSGRRKRYTRRRR